MASGPTSVPVHPDAAPYYAGSGPAGVLLCHGFTGSPRSMRGWAEHLVGEGFRVALPRLPGHGTSWQELNRTDWVDWYASVERDFRTLRAECATVFVAGLSMGGALAVRLAQRYPADVAGLALVNPFLRSRDVRFRALSVLRHLNSLPGIDGDIARPQTNEGAYSRVPLHALHSLTKLWRIIEPDLGALDQPLLLFRSRVDHVVDPSSAELLLSTVGANDVTEVWLERSYHVA
ncbi:MAG: alpha/beta hydrolase, partial [Actinomycetes bacterium]